MKKVFLLIPIAALLICSAKKIDTYPFDKWDSSTMEKANTGKDASFLSAEEKSVVYYMNLARLNPELFEKTYLLKFLDSAKVKSSSFVGSIKNDLLNKYKPMEALVVKEDLSTEATDHAKDLNETGKRTPFSKDGKSYEFRTAKFKGVYKGVVENCDYGNKNPLAIVISMLVDEGTATIEHRNNIMNKMIKFVGVSVQPHKKDKWCCVQEFGK